MLSRWYRNTISCGVLVSTLFQSSNLKDKENENFQLIQQFSIAALAGPVHSSSLWDGTSGWFVCWKRRQKDWFEHSPEIPVPKEIMGSITCHKKNKMWKENLEDPEFKHFRQPILEIYSQHATLIRAVETQGSCTFFFLSKINWGRALQPYQQKPWCPFCSKAIPQIINMNNGSRSSPSWFLFRVW